MTATGLIAFALLACVLILAAISDVRRGIVPNLLTYPTAIAGLGLWTIDGLIRGGLASGVNSFGQAFVAMLCGLIPCVIIYLMGGLGGGDIKLMAAAGAIAGRWPIVLGIGFYACVAVGIMALVVMIRRRIVKQTLHRLWGALLVTAARIKPTFPEDSPRLPFALAVCAGGILAGAEHLLRLRLPWSAG